jgi:hypothetical protein
MHLHQLDWNSLCVWLAIMAAQGLMAMSEARSWKRGSSVLVFVAPCLPPPPMWTRPYHHRTIIKTHPYHACAIY